MLWQDRKASEVQGHLWNWYKIHPLGRNKVLPPYMRYSKWLKVLALCKGEMKEDWGAVRYSFVFSFQTISYSFIFPAPQAVRYLANDADVWDTVLVWGSITLTGRDKLTTVMHCVCNTKPHCTYIFCLSFSLPRAAEIHGHRCCAKDPAPICFLLWLSTESKPSTSTADAVWESIPLRSLCQSPWHDVMPKRNKLCL